MTPAYRRFARGLTGYVAWQDGDLVTVNMPTYVPEPEAPVRVLRALVKGAVGGVGLVVLWWGFASLWMLLEPR